MKREHITVEEVTKLSIQQVRLLCTLDKKSRDCITALLKDVSTKAHVHAPIETLKGTHIICLNLDTLEVSEKLRKISE
jgi:hypothetical protein